MGGKTHQRVAGNVKPSSSGRIRDLLINKHGAGNIITFSALSNSATEKPSESALSPVKVVNIKQPELGPTRSSLVSSDKATLVVKRVGNRECFTRVRFTEDTKPNAVDGTTLFRDELATDLSRLKPEEMLGKENLGSEISKETNEPPNEKVEEGPVLPQEIELEFDHMIDRITELKVRLGELSVNSAEQLTEGYQEISRKLIKMVRKLIENFKKDMSIEDWSIINSLLNEWIDLILADEVSLKHSPQLTKFCTDVFSFLGWLLSLAKRYSKLEESLAQEELPLHHLLLEDWRNFHGSLICQKLVLLYFRNLSQSDADVVDVMNALAGIIIDVDPIVVINEERIIELLDSRVEFDPEVKLPGDSKFCEVDTIRFKGFDAICNLFKSNHRVAVITGHSILSKLIDSVSSESKLAWTLDDVGDTQNLTLFPPEPLFSILTSRDSIVAALLSDYCVGDISITLNPKTDSYSCTLSYLFIWDIVIRFIVGQDKQAAHLMIHCMKKLGLFRRLLDTIFMLLPPLGERDSLKFKLDSEDDDVYGTDLPQSLDGFLKAPLRTAVRRPTNEIELIALHIYFSMALHMPVTVRKWYNNNSSKRLTNLVNEYTVKHISQIICSLEMETVQEKCPERETNDDSEFKLVVKARTTAKEVYAVYTRDEFRMELTVKLPINYPLGPVQIDGGKRVGVTDQKWRSWLLQLTTFLSHQNGSILDGIDLWRRNIDKKFEGIEKCLICFSILHSNYQLPRKKCSTCTKMFHNLCLYKWFESSGNSTCPLCRKTW